MTLRAASLLALVSLSTVVAGCVPSDPTLPSAKEPSKKAAPQDNLAEPAAAPKAEERTTATPASDSSKRVTAPSEPVSGTSEPSTEAGQEAEAAVPAKDKGAEPRLLPPANEPREGAGNNDKGETAPASEESTGPFDDDPFPKGEPPINP